MKKNNFWVGKRVLITGVSGFIGSWMAVWILEQGGKIIGISRGENSTISNYTLCRLDEKILLECGDIKDRNFLQKVCKKYQPEIILHLAGQAIVGHSEEETLSTNILGTLNILECVKESASVKVCLFVTSSKCYGANNCWNTPYSKSKGCADMLIETYRNTFFSPENYELHRKAIINFMLDNVVGGGDWGKNRLVPDCVRAIEENRLILLRTPNAVTYWSSIFDVVKGLSGCVERAFNNSDEALKSCKLARKKENYKTAYDLADLVTRYYGKGQVECAEKRESSCERVYENDIVQGFHNMEFESKKSLEYTIRLAADWYKNCRSEDVYELCREQLLEYMEE